MELNAFTAVPPMAYQPINKCIYCGSIENLSDEHIVPFALGGPWILPKASCSACASKTATFEGKCLRTILGPLRLHLNFPSRRRKSRPDKLALKIRRFSNAAWTEIFIPQKEYPFLVGLPLYDLPVEITGIPISERRDSATRHFWIRGGNLTQNKDEYLQSICDKYGVAGVMPIAKVETHEFALMIAKITHAFTVGRYGLTGFNPFLANIIKNTDTSNSAQFIGGLLQTEPRSTHMHELAFVQNMAMSPDTIVVRIRLLAAYEGPTYYVATGKQLYQP